jgi:glycosyltransferase involved in cell wall biosynthesis
MQSREAQAQLPLSISLATYNRTGASNVFIDTARAWGIPIHVIPERHRFDPAVLSHIKALCSGIQPHLIETHSVKSHSLLKASGVLRSAPWIAFHHGYTRTTKTMLLYNQLDRWSLRSARRTVTVCRAFTSELTACGVPASRIRILHNSVTPFAPVAEEALAALRQEFSLPPGTAVILCIGRLSAEKGQSDLLHALAQLQRGAAPPWKLLLVGDGPDRPALEALVRQYQLQEQVCFAQFRADPAPLFSLADIFVLPSHSEGSSNVLLEAMASGLPIVATRVGGNPEIVEHGVTALLSAPRQPAELAGALQTVLLDGALRKRMGQAAQSHAATAFSPDRYRRTLLEIYREVLSSA